MIEMQGIGKTFAPPERAAVRALDQVSLTIERGQLVAIVGSSGSGKSTLMGLVGLLDRPDTGSYCLDGRDVARLTTNELARLRNERFGFVFQAFRLLPRATALENVELPLLYSRRQRLTGLAEAALESVGLSDRLHHRPGELSGGQQQRVAIARALVNEPDVLLADEPTGNLDGRAALEIIAIFQHLHRAGRTIVIVTHDLSLAQHCDRVATIERGRIVADEMVANPHDAANTLRDMPSVSP